MAAVTTVATAVSAGVGMYNAYQSYDAAQDAKADARQMAAERYAQAQSIDSQLIAEEKLYEEQQKLTEADMLLQQDKLDLLYKNQLENIDMKKDVADVGMQTGIEKILMDVASGSKKAGDDIMSRQSASGFASSGVGQDDTLRKIADSSSFAQKQTSIAYGQSMDALRLQEDQALEGHLLSEDILEQQYERTKFDEYRAYETIVGDLEARQQQLAPGYISGDPEAEAGRREDINNEARRKALEALGGMNFNF